MYENTVWVYKHILEEFVLSLPTLGDLLQVFNKLQKCV